MSGLEMTTVVRDGFCCCMRGSAIGILQIFMPRQYCYSVLSLLRTKKESATGTKVSRSWRAAFSQRSRRGFVVIQDKLMQPRASSAFWSSPASDGREIM